MCYTAAHACFWQQLHEYKYYNNARTVWSVAGGARCFSHSPRLAFSLARRCAPGLHNAPPYALRSVRETTELPPLNRSSFPPLPCPSRPGILTENNFGPQRTYFFYRLVTYPKGAFTKKHITCRWSTVTVKIRVRNVYGYNLTFFFYLIILNYNIWNTTWYTQCVP